MLFWAIVVAVLVAVTGAFWEEIADAYAPSYRLKKDDWSCTASHRMLIIAEGRFGRGGRGRVYCDQYTRTYGRTPVVRVDPR